MTAEFADREKVVGVKQSRKAVRSGWADMVYLACDADPAIVGPIAAACAENEIAVVGEHTMAQLGLACGITVGASVVTVLKRRR